VNVYETEKLLAEYLLFHYGAPDEILPYPFGPRDALEYPARCLSECVGALPPHARALDLGCAVGRSSFELARRCSEVIGIDYSLSFVSAATKLRDCGELGYSRVDEGARTTPLVARIPAEIDRARVTFERGDAQALRDGLGVFDVILMANLIDRLHAPGRCLEQLAGLLKPGGQLVITSPYTWMEEYTPPAHWLCGERGDTLAGLRAELEPAFELIETKDLPFLIREHARKFQWSVAQGSVWRRRGAK
jgi:putative 4-mercaptohistidine N1-methyltranferase